MAKIVQVNGQAVEAVPNETYADILKKAFSGKKFKSIVAASVERDGATSLKDLADPIDPADEKILPIFADSEEGVGIIRHSAAHLMARAVKSLYPEAKVTIGPAIDKGFYYDFDVPTPFSPQDLEKIENAMADLVKMREPFSHRLIGKDEARKLFDSMGETYKLEILDSIPDDTVGIYTYGDFTDLCRGPHVPDASFLENAKLLSVAGAYWRGDENNKMLSRIYGTAFADKKSLDEHLKALEEAKKRDHRKLGRELELFDFEEKVAPGMVFWMPKGMLVRTILEDFWRKEHLKRGYELVQGPQLLRVETWKKSGHYDHYKDNMYFTEIDKDPYGIKPMNCIGHMIIYGHDLHSYKDLPKRYFELGVVHRHEKSGVLHGLMRVRQFTQDDAHIICAPEDLENEIIGVMGLVRTLMNLFDFRFNIAISTRPNDSIGTDEAWELATGALMSAVRKEGLSYVINERDGAFYGPKIDVNLLDSLGRQWQCSTIQVDFTLPERFDLVYVGKDGERHRPVMVHRAIMGSVERFIGVLLEHYGGALPTWLAPEQARIVTVTGNADEAALKVLDELRKNGIRAEADLRNEKLGFKIREARLARIPYCLILGEKEALSGTVSVRLRNGDDLGQKSVADVVAMIREDAEEPFKKGGLSYRFA